VILLFRSNGSKEQDPHEAFDRRVSFLLQRASIGGSRLRLGVPAAITNSLIRVGAISSTKSPSTQKKIVAKILKYLSP
jgi:hypothetical protein